MMGGKEGGGEDEERRVRREGPNQTLNFVSRAVAGMWYIVLSAEVILLFHEFPPQGLVFEFEL